LGEPVAKYFAFADYEEYTRLRCRKVPPGDCPTGWDYMKKHGVYYDRSRPKSYHAHARPLAAKQLEGARVEQASGIIYRKNTAGKEEPIGIYINGRAVVGFATPSRRIEIRSDIVSQQAAKVGVEDNGWPRYIPVPAHEHLSEDMFVLVSFKWNVHTQARTAPQKYLSEIVHDNPLWINTASARKLGLHTGDWVEITTYRPRGQTFQADGGPVGTAKIRVVVTEGIHPRVVAVSNSLGFLFGGRAATARRGPRQSGPGYDPRIIPEDPDLVHNLWWSVDADGKGSGFNINAILPIQPAPVTGMQAWYDTVCTIRKL